MIQQTWRYLKFQIHRVLLHFPMLYWFKLKLKYKLELQKTLQKQLGSENRVYFPTIISRRKRILIPQIETSHYQFYQMLILGKALELRGADIKLLLCGCFLEGCEIKSITNKSKNPCLPCLFNRQHIVPMYGFDILELGDFISQEKMRSLKEIAAGIVADYPCQFIYKDIDIIPMTDDSVIRYYYGAVPDSGKNIEILRQQHLITSMIGIEAAQKIDQEYSPDIILNNMFVYSVTEPYYQYFAKNGSAECFSLSITPSDYHSVMLNSMEQYMSTERFKRYIASRGNSRLTSHERSILRDLLKMRSEGKITMFKDLKYFDQENDIPKILTIDRSKRNIFLFSSVYWDIGMSQSGRLFDNILTWVTQTIEMLRDKDDVHLYIKPHPAEKYDTAASLKGVADYIRERYPELPGNLTLILPEMKIKPYDLMPYIDLGIVYNGTLGLEMLFHDIPVVVTGKAPYGRIGFVHEPLTSEEYENILLGKIPPLRPKIEEIELFAYFYLVKTLIPWNLTRRAYSDNFKGYTFKSLEDLAPGKNKYLDHLCDCILNSKETIIEGWN